MHSTDISCIPAENVTGCTVSRSAAASSTARWYISGRPNSGTSSHFVRITPKAVAVYSTATSMYSSMHSTVCTQLSKLTDFIMKNTTPSTTGMAVVQNARPPNSSRHRMNSRLHISGSAICAAAKN